MDESLDASEDVTNHKKVRFDSITPLTHKRRVPKEQGGMSPYKKRKKPTT
jgi:hypothetical protein